MAHQTPPTSSRLYLEPWKVLKAHGSVSLIPTSSKDPDKVKRFVRAARKGIQKEKYKDIPFRLKYPDSKLSSEVDEATNKITFTLNLGMTYSLDDFEVEDKQR